MRGGNCRSESFYFLIFVLSKGYSTDNLSVAAEDGKFVGDSDVGEFWSLFGGYAPIPRDSPSAFQQQPDTPSTTFFWLVLSWYLEKSM